MLILLLLILVVIVIILLLTSSNKKENKKLASKLDDAFEFSGIPNEEDEDDEEQRKEERPLTKKEQREKDLEVKLIRAGFPLKPKEFTRIRILSSIVAFLLFLFLAKNVFLAIIFLIVMYLAPNFYLQFATEKKKQKFEDQIPIALSLIRNSVEAGFSFVQAMEVVATEMDPPISEEFARVLHELNVGKDMEEALNNMQERIMSDELKLVIVAVLIQREVGGNLGGIIEVILETINDRIQIKGEIKTLTSQGRLSAIVICLLPFVLGIIMYFMNPDYMTPLLTTGLGQLLIGAAVFMIIIGAVLINKIVKVDF